MLIVKLIEYDPLAVVLRSLCGHAIRDRYFSAIVVYTTVPRFGETYSQLIKNDVIDGLT